MITAVQPEKSLHAHSVLARPTHRPLPRPAAPITAPIQPENLAMPMVSLPAPHNARAQARSHS
jgi:hypothetical protein